MSRVFGDTRVYQALFLRLLLEAPLDGNVQLAPLPFSNYLIRVAVADMAALEKFILEQLTPIPGIEKIRSSFALKQVR